MRQLFRSSCLASGDRGPIGSGRSPGSVLYCQRSCLAVYWIGLMLCPAWMPLSWGQLSSGASPSGAAQELPRPNVVILVADDLGYGELGCQGNPEIATPHIDALAQQGVRCTQAYVTAPNCSPSRAGLLTGRIPTRFGYEFNPIGARNEDPGTGLPPAETTLAEHVHAAGYATGLIGKWHLGGAADYHPQRHGFDEFFGFLHEGHYYVPPPWMNVMTMLRRRGLPAPGGQRFAAAANLIYSSHMGHDEPPYDANNPILRAGQPVAEAEYLTEAITREAVDFIERHRQQPFLLCVTYNAVHSPLQAKLETLQRLAAIEDMHRRIFAAMLVDLDTSVGDILAALDDNSLRAQTLVIFLSDNGGPTKELTSSNAPLRAGKGSMYEGGLRVPFMVSWPGQLPTGEVCHEVVSSLDIFPTVARVCGTPVPQNLDGHSLLEVLRDRNASTAHAQLYWRQGGRAALRAGRWKIVAPDARPTGPRRWELFDIEADISESTDLAQQMPDRLAELVRMWESYDARMAEPLF